MGIGFGLLLIAGGAILAWAVDATTSGFNVHAAGYILLVVGIISVVLSLVFGRIGRVPATSLGAAGRDGESSKKTSSRPHSGLQPIVILQPISWSRTFFQLGPEQGEIESPVGGCTAGPARGGSSGRRTSDSPQEHRRPVEAPRLPLQPPVPTDGGLT